MCVLKSLPGEGLSVAVRLQVLVGGGRSLLVLKLDMHV